MMTTDGAGDFVQRARHVLPGGVLGSHRNGEGLEFVVKEGRGAYLWDTQGRRYIDYLLDGGGSGVRVGDAVTRNGSASRSGHSIQEVWMEQTPPDLKTAPYGVC